MQIWVDLKMFFCDFGFYFDRGLEWSLEELHEQFLL